MTPDHDFLGLSTQLFEKLDDISKMVTNLNKWKVIVNKRLKELEGAAK